MIVVLQQRHGLARRKKRNVEVRLRTEVVAAYGRLAKAVGFAAGGDPSVAPNLEGAPLDPQKAMEAERVRASFGVLDSVKKGVLSGLRQVSFWLMKNRACISLSARSSRRAPMHRCT